MLVAFGCVELFEEGAGLGCPGAGECLEDGEGIVPAAACGTEYVEGIDFAGPVAYLAVDRQRLAARGDSLFELAEVHAGPGGGVQRDALTQRSRRARQGEPLRHAVPSAA
jgi:hypothetical protein